MKHLRVTALAVLLLALGTLTACGADNSGDSGSGSSASASPGAEGSQPGGGDPTQLAAIQQCLEAAGLGDTLPSGGPGSGGTPPSGAPTGTPPSGFPSGGPSGGPAGGGLGEAFNDPDVQAALQACGIELPSAPAAPTGAAGS